MLEQSKFNFPQLFIEMNQEGFLDSKKFIDMNHLDSQKYVCVV